MGIRLTYLYREIFISNSFAFRNGPSLFHKLALHKAIAFHIHMNSVNEPQWEVSSYTIQASYRQRIYKDWLFLQVTPFLNFPRTNNFFRNPGLFLEVEGVFGYVK